MLSERITQVLGWLFADTLLVCAAVLAVGVTVLGCVALVEVIL